MPQVFTLLDYIVLVSMIYHHALSAAMVYSQENSIEALTTTTERFTNPFAEERLDLFNRVTKTVMPDKLKSDLCTGSTIGEQLFEEFVTNRITSAKVNIRATMETRKLQTWNTRVKRVKLNTGDKVVEIKEGRKPFTRMLLVSRPNINLGGKSRPNTNLGGNSQQRRVVCSTKVNIRGCWYNAALSHEEQSDGHSLEAAKK